MEATSELELYEAQLADDAALWHVDLADIAKQTDVPTAVLLGAMITSSARPDPDAAIAGMFALSTHVCVLLRTRYPAIRT